MPLESKSSAKPENDAAYSASLFAGDLLSSAAYSAFAAPIEGCLQIVDASGTKLQAKSQDFFAHIGVEAPQPNASGAKWWAQTLGSAGMVVPLLVLRKPVRGIVSELGTTGIFAKQSTLGFTLQESAITGFLQGSIFSPSDNQKNLFGERCINGTSSAVLFLGMTTTSHGINKLADTGFAFKHRLNVALTNPIATGLLSGVPGGALGAEIEAVKQGRPLPSRAELSESVMSMTVMGGVFGAKHLVAEKQAVRSSITSQSQYLLSNSEVRSLIRAPRLDEAMPQFVKNAVGTNLTIGLPNLQRPNGRTVVEDLSNQVAHTYNSSGRLIEARNMADDNRQTYAYNSAGDLRAVITEQNQGWFKVNDGWAQGGIDRTSGRLELFPARAKWAAIDADGLLLAKADKAWSVPLTARWQNIDANSTEIKSWNLDREKKVTDYLSNHTPSALLATELANFHASALANNLMNGYGQVQAEVNRSLTAGKTAEAISLLQAAQKLLSIKGVTTLQAIRTSDGALSLAGQGFRDSIFTRHLLDGTVIKTNQKSRTTEFPDGTKNLELFGEEPKQTIHHRADGKIEQVKTATSIGDLIQDVNYSDADGSVTSVRYAIGDKSTTLKQQNGDWLIKREVTDRPELTEEIKLEQTKGLVHLHENGNGNGIAIFNSGNSDSKSSFIIFSDAGKVVQNVSGRNTELTPGEGTRLVKANFEIETSRLHQLTDQKLSSEQEREKFITASSQFNETAGKVGLEPKKQAILLAEINRSLTNHTDLIRTTKLFEKITEATELLNKSPELQQNSVKQDISVEQLKDKTAVYIGNKTIEISASDDITIKNNLMFRFDGVTDSQFKSKVARTVASNLTPAVANLLLAHGNVIIGSDTIATAFPDIVHQQPSGWPYGVTMEVLDAKYNPAEKRIVVAQNHQVYSGGKSQTIRTVEPEAALLRAVGHAVDDALGSFSSSKEFTGAYEADLQKLSVGSQLDFYTKYAIKENTANLFADLFAGTQRKIEQADYLREHFPNAAAMVDDAVKLIQSEKLPGNQVQNQSDKVNESQAHENKQKEPDSRSQMLPLNSEFSFERQPAVQELLHAAVGSKAVIQNYVTKQLGDLQVTLPAAIAEVREIRADHSQVTPWSGGDMIKYTDGTVEVIDKTSGLNRTFNSAGQMIKANVEGGKNHQQYIYDEEGNLKAAFFDQSSALIHTAEGWQDIRPTPSLKYLVVEPSNFHKVVIHPEGGILSASSHTWRSQMANGRNGRLTDKGFDFETADPIFEQRLVNKLIDRIAEPTKAKQISNLVSEFSILADKNNIRPDMQATFLAEVTETLKNNGLQALPLLETTTDWLRHGKFKYLSIEHKPDQTMELFLSGESGYRKFWSNGKTETYNHEVKETKFPDGTFKREISGSDGGTSYGYDHDGRMISKTFGPSFDNERIYKHIKDGKLTAVIDNMKDGSSHTISKEEGIWAETIKGSDGTETKTILGQGKVDISNDGTVVFKPLDNLQPRIVYDHPGQALLYYPDQRVERRQPNGRTDFIGADYHHERQLLQTNIKEVFNNDHPKSELRLTRFEKMMTQYQELSSTAEVPPEKQALVLLQLNRLLTNNPQAKLSLAERGDLAEQLLAHVVDPLKIWQGDHPTCNVATIEHRLAVQSPDKLIAMVADITVNGSYVRTDGRSVDASRIVGSLRPDKESTIKLERQRSGTGLVVNWDGSRNWASQITQSVLIRSAWMEKEFYMMGNQIAPEFTVSWVKDIASGTHKPVKVDPSDILPIDPRRYDLEPLYDSDQSRIGMVPSKAFVPLRGHNGQWLDKLSLGETAYDKFGRPLIHRADINEIGFGPTYLGDDTLVVFADHNLRPIVDFDSTLAKSPNMDLNDIAKAYQSVDNNPSALPFIINHSTVKTPEHLVAILDDLQHGAQLPGILAVHTRSQAFGHWDEGGWHVVNVYGRDEMNRIKYSNQWGSYADRMRDGIDANIVFAAMRAPFTPPPTSQILLPIPLYSNSNSSPSVENLPNFQTGSPTKSNPTKSKESTFSNRFSWLNIFNKE